MFEKCNMSYSIVHMRPGGCSTLLWTTALLILTVCAHVHLQSISQQADRDAVTPEGSRLGSHAGEGRRRRSLAAVRGVGAPTLLPPTQRRRRGRAPWRGRVRDVDVQVVEPHAHLVARDRRQRGERRRRRARALQGMQHLQRKGGAGSRVDAMMHARADLDTLRWPTRAPSAHRSARARTCKTLVAEGA